jgi:hypothetical protein
MDIYGVVVRGTGTEKYTGFPTANMKVDVWDKLDKTLYVCDSDYGPALVWKLVDVKDEVMAYFINLPTYGNIYNEKILLKNLRGVNFQRENELVSIITELHSPYYKYMKWIIIILICIIIYLYYKN